jgi:ribonuclease I
MIKPFFYTLLLGGGILTEYIYYDLALKKCHTSDAYTIHGLWPEYNHTLWPQFCGLHQSFNLSELTPLKYLLNKFWKSCEGQSETFWQHEWEKHGRCQPLNQLQYFNKTINLYNYVSNDIGYNRSIISKNCNPNAKQCLLHINLNYTYLI